MFLREEPKFKIGEEVFVTVENKIPYGSDTIVVGPGKGIITDIQEYNDMYIYTIQRDHYMIPDLKITEPEHCLTKMEIDND